MMGRARARLRCIVLAWVWDMLIESDGLGGWGFGGVVGLFVLGCDFGGWRRCY